MKKYIAFLLCLIVVLSLFSCKSNQDQDTLPPNENTDSSRAVEDDSTNEISKAEIAMQMFEAAINDEICVFDERLGEIKLKSLRFPSNNTKLDECKLLTKAMLDVDQDGVNEYVIQSLDHEYIILR